MPDITTREFTKTQLILKGKKLLPRTSIECVYDPKTGQPIDLSKYMPADSGSAKTYTINGKAADINGNFSVTASDVGAAPSDHTHTAASIGAADANHTHTAASIGAAAADHTHTAASIGAANAQHAHTISDIDGLEARLLEIGAGEGGDGIALDVIPYTSQSFPEPSSWNNN